MTPRLLAVAGPFQGAEYPIDQPSVSIGRESSNAVCLHDPRVSRRDARIACEDSRLTLTDLGSFNRTSVNGVPVCERTLEHGDLIAIGHSVLLVDLDGGPRQPAAIGVSLDGDTVSTEPAVVLQ